MNLPRIIWRAAATAALLFALGASVAWAHGTADQSNDPVTGTSYSCGGSGSLFQGFTPSRRQLASVDLRMRKGGSFPASGATLDVNVRGAEPRGQVLGSATAFVSATDSFTPLVHFDFNPPLALEPQGLFVIEFRTVHPAIVTWMGRSDNPYPAGTSHDCVGTAGEQPDFNFISSLPADGGPPGTTIDADRTVASITRKRVAQISFSGTDDLSYSSNLVFSCELDGHGSMPCTSPLTLESLRDGAHVFTVTAADQAGQRDASPARVSWIVDGTAPSAPGVTGPRRLVRARVVFRFASRDSFDPPRRLKFRCAIDSRRLAPCASRVARRFSVGSHVLRVVAVDRAGNVSRATVVRVVRK